MSSYNNEKGLEPEELSRDLKVLRYASRPLIVGVTITIGWMAWTLTQAVGTNIWPWWIMWGMNGQPNPAHPLDSGPAYILVVGMYWMATGYVLRVAIRSVGRLVWPSKFPVED